MTVPFWRAISSRYLSVFLSTKELLQRFRFYKWKKGRQTTLKFTCGDRLTTITNLNAQNQEEKLTVCPWIFKLVKQKLLFHIDRIGKYFSEYNLKYINILKYSNILKYINILNILTNCDLLFRCKGLQPNNWGRRQKNIIHYVPSENWDLLPYITTLGYSCPVSSWRQRKTDASHDRNVWKCGWLSSAAIAPWSSMGRVGNTCCSGKQKPSLPHPSSVREIAAGKSGPSPSTEETS